MWPFKQSGDFTLKHSLFGAVKLTEYVDPNKYKYSGYGIEFDVSRKFLLFVGNGFGKNVITFGADMSSSAHIDNIKKNIPISSKDPTLGLDDTTLAVEKEHAINFSKQQKKFCLSLHYIDTNS